MKGQIERAEHSGLTKANHAIARRWAELHREMDGAQTQAERDAIEAKFSGLAEANLAVCQEIDQACRS